MNYPYWSSRAALAEKLKTTPKTNIASKEPSIGLLLGDAIQGWFQSNPYDMTWDENGSVSPQDWQKKAYEFLTKGLHWRAPKNAAFDPVIREVKDVDGYRRTELEITLTFPLRAPATILEPLEKIDAKNPAILLLHCMGGYRLYGREKVLPLKDESQTLKDYQQVCYGGQSIAESLVKKGYVVMVIDALNFGERTFSGMEDKSAFLKWRQTTTVEDVWPYTQKVDKEEAGVVRCIQGLGRSWCAMILQDDIRSVDFLSQWPSVDTERMGCGGLSFGSYRTNMLAAMDRRIRAAVSVCWTSSLNDLINHNDGWSLPWFIQIGDSLSRLDIPDIQALVAPRAFLAISGWQDVLFTHYSMARAHDKLRRFFTAYGCPEQLGSMLLPAVHEFNVSMQELAIHFFDDKLKSH